MTEEIYICPKCKQIESYAYSSFDEIVAYTHCKCKRHQRLSDKDILAAALKELDKIYSVSSMMYGTKGKE